MSCISWARPARRSSASFSTSRASRGNHTSTCPPMRTSALVPRHQSARPGAGAGARRRRAHRKQRHHRLSRKTFPTPKLIPAGHENEVAALLRHEDDLHLDLRTLSFRFVFDRPARPSRRKRSELCRQRLRHRAGCRGSRQADPDRVWERAAKEGFTDQSARASAQKFRAEFDALEQRLRNSI